MPCPAVSSWIAFSRFAVIVRLTLCQSRIRLGTLSEA